MQRLPEKIYFIKHTPFIFLIASLFVLISPISLAQVPTSNPLDIRVYFSEQNPETKVFKAKVEINSKVSSSRNTMKWTLPEGIRTKSGVNELEGFYCKLKEGINTVCLRDTTKPQTDSFEFEIDLVAYKQVDDVIVFSIQSYIDGAEKSYSVTQIANVKINSKLELEPVTAQFKDLQNLINIRQLSTKLTLIVFVMFIGLIIIRRTYLYVNPPVKSSLPHDSKILDAYQALAKSSNNGSMQKN
ncbi:hypothetical protein KBD45_02450 [Candidatus Dojkabacteria bacterium]|nr:hypothetical protein [Candidatus Dojkabacteria bacterium]